MIQIVCKECGTKYEFSDKVYFCTSCFHQFFQQKHQTHKKIIYTKVNKYKLNKMMENNGWTEKEAVDWMNRREELI